MTPKSRLQWGRIGLVLLMTAVFLLAISSVAFAAVSQQHESAVYQPYEYGPVIHAPYAPYTAYQPYEYGPVVHTDWLEPYAPYTPSYKPGEFGRLRPDL